MHVCGIASIECEQYVLTVLFYNGINFKIMDLFLGIGQNSVLSTIPSVPNETKDSISDLEVFLSAFFLRLEERETVKNVNT